MTLNRSVQNVNPPVGEIFDRGVHKSVGHAYDDLMTAEMTPTRGRGRPRQFDEEEVLDALVELFWEQGFEHASLQEIVEAAGLNKSSLYNAFGSKDELFFAVLERYMDLRQQRIDETFPADGGFENVLTFLDVMRAELSSPGAYRGCLAVNATTELGLREDRVADVADRYRKMMGAALRRALERAEAAGEIAPGFVDVYVDVVVGFAVSIMVAARSGAPVEELERQIDSLAALVESWRR